MVKFKMSLKHKLKEISVVGLLFFLSLFLMQCKPSQNTLDLRNGDLLFVTAKEEGLSGAINKVTQKEKATSFDHIGIVEKEGDHIFVLHAAPKGGAQKQDLKAFIKDQKEEGQKVIAYRLKPEYQNAVPAAIKKAHSMLGKPYNFEYILDENSFYCSDFVERAFREAHIFKLEPMTFKDPATGKINVFWEEFYKKKNLKVPEGEPGCNPNGLAGSDKIERVEEL